MVKVILDLEPLKQLIRDRAIAGTCQGENHIFVAAVNRAINDVAVEAPDAPREEWVCSGCHGVVAGDFCHKCHPAKTKRLSLMMEYVRLRTKLDEVPDTPDVLGELKKWLEAELAFSRKGVGGHKPELGIHLFRWEGRIDELVGTLAWINKLQAEAEKPTAADVLDPNPGDAARQGA